MPLFTHLASLNLNLSQKIDIDILKKALKSQLAVNSEQDTEPSKNPQLAQAVLAESLESSETIMVVLRKFTSSIDFEEETWVSLHIACQRFPDIRPQIQGFIFNLLASMSPEVALQARLFLMSQSDFDRTIVDSIIALDDWAFLTCLTRVEDLNWSDAKFATRFTAAIHQMMEYHYNGEQRTDSLFKVFVDTSGIDVAEKQILLNNIAKLAININEYSIQALRAILPNFLSENAVTGKKIAITPTLKSFLQSLTHALFSQWTIAYRTEEERASYAKKIRKNPALAQEVKKDQNQWSARVLQENFLALLTVCPALLDSDGQDNLKELCREKINEAIKVIDKGFIAKLPPVLNKLSDNSIDWLMTLDIFTSFSFLKVDSTSLKNLLINIFSADNHLYKKIMRLNFSHSEKPMFAFMVRQKSYADLTSELVKKFFEQADFKDNITHYLIYASSAFKALPYISCLPKVTIFITSSENHTITQLDAFMDTGGSEVDAMYTIVKKLQANFSSQAFVERLLGCYGGIIEAMLKSLFPEKYTLAHLSELKGDPETNRIYIGFEKAALRARFLVSNGNFANYILDRDALNTAIGLEGSVEDLIDDPRNHDHIFNALLQVSYGVKNNISSQDINDSEVIKRRESAGRKIEHLFKLAKIVRTQSPEEYKKLRENPIFMRLAIRYRYSKYYSHSGTAEVKNAQQACIRYLDENLDVIIRPSDSSAVAPERDEPFLWPVYARLHASSSAEMLQWSEDCQAPFETWIDEKLFPVPSRAASIRPNQGIGSVKLAETLHNAFGDMHMIRILKGVARLKQRLSVLVRIPQSQLDELREIILGGINVIRTKTYTMNDREAFLSALKYDLHDEFQQLLIDMLNFDDIPKQQASKIRYAKIHSLVKQMKLSLDEQKALYRNEDEFVLAKLQFRYDQYEAQQRERVALGLGRDPKKEAKMKVLYWLICNFENIKKNVYNCPLKQVYDMCGPDEYRVTDIALVDNWFRNVILKNSPIAQAAAHGFGMFGAVKGGKKGSKMAETLVLLSHDSDELLSKIIKGTHITLLEIWNAAFPGRQCATEAERQVARNAMILTDIADNEDASSIDNNSARDEDVEETIQDGRPQSGGWTIFARCDEDAERHSNVEVISALHS